MELPELVSNEEAILVDLYAKNHTSVVNIITYTNQGQRLMATGQGSGFVFNDQGDIVTNSHVIQGAEDLEVVLSDGTIHAATIVGDDPHSDLAVINVETLPDNIEPLILGEMDKVAVGQTVVAIGNPFGLGGTLTKGVVSAKGRSIPALTQFSIPQSIQTDAPINPGNSGGPLLNLQGEVIGVNAQIETDGESRVNSGVGFAIPVSIVERVVPKLVENGEFEWGWLGVIGRTVSPSLVEEMNLPVNSGAYISEVVDGGPSDKAGLIGASREIVSNGRLLQTGGDVIIAIDGNQVNTFEDLLIYIALKTSSSQKVTLTVLRDGETQDIDVTLEPRPPDPRQQFLFP
jgi:2-alkenal reductase